MADSGYPRLELDNGEIRGSIYLPDPVHGYYRGARFDWSGIIFTLIDGQPYGPDYRVEFPFATAKPIPVKQRAWFRGNAIEVPQALGDSSLWLPLYEGDARVDYNRALIKHLPSGAAGEIKEWSSRYRFSDGS